MIVSLFLSLFNCALDIFETGKRVYHGGKYGLEILVNFLFYGPEEAIKLAKKITKVKENLEETVKHC